MVIMLDTSLHSVRMCTSHNCCIFDVEQQAWVQKFESTIGCQDSLHDTMCQTLLLFTVHVSCEGLQGLQVAFCCSMITGQQPPHLSRVLTNSVSTCAGNCGRCSGVVQN